MHSLNVPVVCGVNQLCVLLSLLTKLIALMAKVGLELERSFGGKASKLVESCDKSAAKLVTLIASHFPGIFVFYSFPFT